MNRNNVENLEVFAQRVRELRRERRLTQAELGNALGLTHKSISTIESGHRTTTLEKLIVLAKYFNVSADYLLGLTDRRDRL